MSKRKKYNDFDEMDDIAGTGDLAQFENYSKFDVDDKVQELTTKTKSFLLQIARTHLGRFLDVNEEYIASICDAESTNVLFLMKQVKYSEHVLDTLMRQLDSGGYMDPSLFETIRVMQKSGVELTLEVSRYLRTLPEYFKFLEKELAAKTNEAIEYEKSQQSLELKSSNVDDDEYDDDAESTFDMSGPIMGTRELMLSIASSKESLKTALQNSEEITPTPIIVDEEGIHTTEIDTNE